MLNRPWPLYSRARCLYWEILFVMIHLLIFIKFVTNFNYFKRFEDYKLTDKYVKSLKKLTRYIEDALMRLPLAFRSR